MTDRFVDMVASFGNMMTRVLAKIDTKLDTAGTASKATKLATARTLSLTGDGTATLTFDGSGNASAVLTLSGSGVTAGTYPKVTVNAKGLVTAGAALLAADIPVLDAAKITTGTFAVARIPTLNQSTTGNAATATIAARVGKNGLTAVGMSFNDTIRGTNPVNIWGTDNNTDFYLHSPASLTVGSSSDCVALKSMGRRDVFVSTTAPSAGAGVDGDIWLVY